MSFGELQAPFDVYAIRLSDLSPWNLFDSVWKKALQGHPADSLDITPGVTPLLTLKPVLAVLLTYYIVIFTGREFMKNRPAFKFHDLFLVHNFFLTSISGGLLVLFIEQLVPTLWKDGLFDTICGDGGWTGPLVTLYYLNYLTKYLELFDTLFLVLKKKPLTFLHTYHHGATAFLCYTQLAGHTPVSWVPISLNLTVHVVMYWYYFQAARGITIWWKKWITRLQIAQFVLDLGFVYFATYNYYATAYFPNLPHIGTCAGEPFAAFTGCVILTSYLFLFLAFYTATYKRASNKQKDSVQAITKEMPRAAAKELKETKIPTISETSDAANEIFHAAEGLMKAAGSQMAFTNGRE